MKRVVLSRAARNDRRAITEYTVEQFGIRQARRLRERFEATMNSLAESPSIGHVNEELDPPGHRFRYFAVMKRFIIVYEPTGHGIRVARLLHGARNVAVELETDAGNEDN